MSQSIEGRILEPYDCAPPERTMRLGEAALLASGQLADMRGRGQLADRPLPAHMETGMEFSVSSALERVRQTVADIDEAHDQAMNAYCRVSAPLRIVDAAGGRAAARWRHWLTEGAADDQLLEFLAWNYEATLGIQDDPKVRLEIDRQKASYKTAVVRGVQEGWLHPAARAAVDDVDTAPIYIGDPFDTYFRDIAGYYKPGADWVVVGGERCNTSWRSGVLAQLARISKHELNHLALGELEPTFWWLNEAATEHIARSLEEGQPEVLHPDRRGKSGTIYNAERVLMDYLLNAGQRTIPVRDMTRAYSSMNLADRLEFMDKLNDAWSHVAPDDDSAMGCLDDFIGYREEKLLKGGMRGPAAQHAAVKETYDIIRSKPHQIFSPTFFKAATVFEPTGEAGREAI
ncbi:MAG TPA: hypothetical protein VHC21_00490 [Candidatus Saccharimonadales bacterium]|nr:hypothetical protein [Candidatus Saccharimonadales bacterium]